jgi:hypothetical protein
MLSWQEEMREREQVQENDRRLREQQQKQQQEPANTMHQHALSAANDESGGRYGVARPAPTVTGSTPIVKYPQLPSDSPWSGQAPEPGPEPPLNYEINRLTPYELEPSMAASSVEDPAGATSSPADPGGAESAPSFPASDVEHPAPPSSSTEDSRG